MRPAVDIHPHRFERLKELVTALPEVAGWSEMGRLISKAVHRDWTSVWDYPVASCLACGGAEDDALPGAAAMFCALLGIHLVDDLLDEDPAGDYRRLGGGAVANLALAFQAAAHRLLDSPRLADATRAELQSRLASAFLATSLGQSLDAIEARDEAGYWQRVEAKTPPLFAVALAIGGLFVGADAGIVSGLDRLGRALGRFVQVSDDLADALAIPASADWTRPRNNLALLYALAADHGERETFSRLAARVDDADALESAQRILLKSGAVSYCAHQMVELSARARAEAADLELVDAGSIDRLVDRLTRPLSFLLAVGGLDRDAFVAARIDVR